jgi:hypothetical protein
MNHEFVPMWNETHTISGRTQAQPRAPKNLYRILVIAAWRVKEIMGKICRFLDKRGRPSQFSGVKSRYTSV